MWGHLLTPSGRLLSRAFEKESPPGWQEVALNPPSSRSRRTSSTWPRIMPAWLLRVRQRHFRRRGRRRATAARLVRSGVAGANGVFLYGLAGFPPRAAPATTGSMSSSRSTRRPIPRPHGPQSGAGGGLRNVPLSSTVRVAFNESIDPARPDAIHLRAPRSIRRRGAGAGQLRRRHAHRDRRHHRGTGGLIHLHRNPDPRIRRRARPRRQSAGLRRLLVIHHGRGGAGGGRWTRRTDPDHRERVQSRSGAITPKFSARKG